MLAERYLLFSLKLYQGDEGMNWHRQNGVSENKMAIKESFTEHLLCADQYVKLFIYFHISNPYTNLMRMIISFLSLQMMRRKFKELVQGGSAS